MRLILLAFTFLTKLLAHILGKRSKLKTATEQLPETSPTADAVATAEALADEKFKLRLVQEEAEKSKQEAAAKELSRLDHPFPKE